MWTFKYSCSFGCHFPMDKSTSKFATAFAACCLIRSLSDRHSSSKISIPPMSTIRLLFPTAARQSGGRGEYEEIQLFIKDGQRGRCWMGGENESPRISRQLRANSPSAGGGKCLDREHAASSHEYRSPYYYGLSKLV